MIAAICFSDLERWPELIPTLLNNVTDDAAPEGAKKVSLEAMGFICEQIVPEQLGQVMRGWCEGGKRVDTGSETWHV